MTDEQDFPLFLPKILYYAFPITQAITKIVCERAKSSLLVKI